MSAFGDEVEAVEGFDVAEAFGEAFCLDDRRHGCSSWSVPGDSLMTEGHRSAAECDAQGRNACAPPSATSSLYAPGPMTTRDRARFARVLGLILFAALGLRFAYIVTVTRHDHRFYDATYYEAETRSIADGRGFTDPFLFGKTHLGPSAAHPPLIELVLVPAALVSDDAIVMRFEMALLGVGVVAAIAFLGRAVAYYRVGHVAAAIAAAYPNLWMNDGLIMS